MVERLPSRVRWNVAITFRPLGYDSVYLPLRGVADTPLYIQGDVLFSKLTMMYSPRLRTIFECLGN